MKFKIKNISDNNSLKLFDNWFRSNNGISLIKVSSNGKYRGTISKKYIKTGENVLEIPKKLLIISSDYKSDYKNDNLSNYSKLLLLTFNYWRSGRFEEYFNIIPKKFNDFPIYWSDEKIESIKNTFIYEKIIQKKAGFQSLFEKLKDYQPQLTFNDYKYIWTIIASRNFSININGERVNVLAPYGDMLNHSFNQNTRWFFDDSKNAFIFKAIENIEIYKEVTDTNGIKPSINYLFYYGFFPPDHHSINFQNLKLTNNRQDNRQDLSPEQNLILLKKLDQLKLDLESIKDKEDLKLQKLILETEIQILENNTLQIVKLNINKKFNIIKLNN